MLLAKLSRILFILTLINLYLIAVTSLVAVVNLFGLDYWTAVGLTLCLAVVVWLIILISGGTPAPTVEAVAAQVIAKATTSTQTSVSLGEVNKILERGRVGKGQIQRAIAILGARECVAVKSGPGKMLYLVVTNRPELLKISKETRQ